MTLMLRVFYITLEARQSQAPLAPETLRKSKCVAA